MNLMDTAQLLGNFGEFFGAIAVVGTLGYLAVQIRQNSRMMESTRRQELAKADQDALIGFTAHAAAFAKMNLEEPPQWDTPAEKWESWLLAVSAFRSWENFAWQHANGLIPKTAIRLNLRRFNNKNGHESVPKVCQFLIYQRQSIISN